MSPTTTDRIPTPRSLLGFEIAERPMHYHEMVACLTTLAAASDRAVLSQYGETPTGCQLLKLTVSSPRNLARLAEIDAALERLGGGTLDESEASALAGSLPAVVWLGYGIHGDEISGTDAAVSLAYRLLSGEDAETRALLDSLVIHIDPMFNPDGRERCLAHHTAFSRRMPFDDPQDIFQNQFWPEGRGNHYLFDMNRDAIFAVQRQSRSRVAAILAARPQIYVDAHEMNATDSYLFAVPAEPLNPHLPPAVHDSWREFGADHGEALDAAGVSYYTRSWNEVFYPGFFDIWPSYHGAVPILYEQSATGGVAVRLPSGRLRTYREAVDNQLTSSVANLKTAASKKTELLMRWARSRTAAAKGAGVAKAWIIPPTDAYRQRRIRELLETQSIRCEQLTKSTQVDGLRSVWSADAQRVQLPAGTLLVPTAQPLGALVRNVFDFHVPLDDEFLRRERRGLDLGSKTLLFDATAWSLPLAFGVDAYWATTVPKGEWKPVNTQAKAASRVAGTAADGKARYGWIYSDPSMAATARLMALGIKVAIAREAFVYSGVRHEAGTLVIRRDDQGKLSDETLSALREATVGVDLIAVESARMEQGPDLGDREFPLLVAPSVAILTGPGFNGPNTGALWHLFDVEVGMPVTLLEFARPGGFDLAAYNVIVIADTMDRAALVAGLKHGWLEKLKHWVHAGGTLIGLSGSALALAEAGFTTTRARSEVLDQYPPLALGRPAAVAIDEDFARATGSASLQGTGDAGSMRVAAKGGDSSDQFRLPVISAGARAFVGESSPTYEFPSEPAAYDDWLAGVPRTGNVHCGLGELLRKYLPRGAYLRANLKPLHWLRYGVADRLPALFRESDALIADSGKIDVVGRYAAPRELAMSGLVWPESVGYIAGTAYLVRERMGNGQTILFGNDPVFRGYSLGTQRLFVNAAILGPGLKGL